MTRLCVTCKRVTWQWDALCLKCKDRQDKDNDRREEWVG